jgi:hypothetical protein
MKGEKSEKEVKEVKEVKEENPRMLFVVGARNYSFATTVATVSLQCRLSGRQSNGPP